MEQVRQAITLQVEETKYLPLNSMTLCPEHRRARIFARVAPDFDEMSFDYLQRRDTLNFRSV